MRIARCLFLLLISAIICFAGCVATYPEHPTEGIWYCEELSLSLDMETLTGQIVISDETLPVYAQIDYGKGIFISLGENQWDESFENTDILNATFELENNLFILTDIHTHHSYFFFEIK